MGCFFKSDGNYFHAPPNVRWKETFQFRENKIIFLNFHYSSTKPKSAELDISFLFEYTDLEYLDTSAEIYFEK